MSNKNAKIRLFVENTLKPGAIILCEQNQGHYLVNVIWCLFLTEEKASG
jgi:hypothetical protein